MINKKELNKRLLGIISDVKNTKTIKAFPYLLETLKNTEFELENNEFKITIVGEFSSGKSTFLNAIIGKDILPHGVKETTAAVTYIHNVPQNDRRLNKAVIHFREETMKDITLDVGENRNALVDYVTTSDKKYRVVQDIVSVDIYVHFADIEDPIVLIDTPGMNGVAEGHKDITLHEIRHSHASICLFHLRGMGKSDLEFIKELMKYQETFFFVLNAIDDIKANEETYEGRMQAFVNDIVNYVYDGKKKPEYVFGVSALKALGARDRNITRVYDTDQKDLQENDRVRLLEESKMPVLENALFKYLRNSDKDKEFYKTICQRLLQTINTYKAAADTDKAIREAKREDIPEKKKILELMDKAERTTKTFRDSIETNVKAGLEELRADLYEIIRDDINKEYTGLITYIKGLSFDEALRAADTNVVGKKLGDFWNSHKVLLSEGISNGIYKIQQAIVVDMQQAIPSISFKDKQIKIDVEAKFEGFDNLPMISRLSRLKQEKEKIQRDINTSKGGASSDILNRQLSAIMNEMSQLERERSAKLRNLGARPGVGHRTEYNKVIDNGFTNLWGLFGDRYKTVEKVVPDYSAQNRYDANRRDIEQQYASKIQTKQREKNAMEQKVDAARNNENLRQLWESKVRNIEAEIQREEKLLEEAKKNAYTSFLKKIQQDLQKQVDTYLTLPGGQMYADLVAGVRENLQSSINPILVALYGIFDQKKKEYISNLQNMIARIEGSSDNVENSKTIQILSSDINVLNNCINIIKNISNGL
ncbi:dynamin family protein [Capnocytophaga granulosa]|uniref:dynamin family protein n=1 Tax=Capnocytophaga granulosa TaxID=45242 RepID=UPI003C7375E0